MKTVVISQPMYFPWAGYMGQMAQADCYIWLDDAQFSKGSFTSRVQVKSTNGRNWMSIPLEKKGAFQEIRQLSAADSDWLRSHRELLRQQLAGAPHLPLALSVFDESVTRDALVDLLIASCEVPALEMGILPAEILRSSEMGVFGRSSQRVVDLVRAVQGTRYLTGHGAARYLDHHLFEDAGIAVEYMAYDVAPWPQFHGEFTPFVTILDAMAHLGKSAANHLGGATIGWREFVHERGKAE